jgi:alkylation response protein AidB-like acyl-CoA dehydrogenase
VDLDLTDEQRAVADLARDLGLRVLAPAARQAEAAGVVPDVVAAALHGTGLTAPVPEDFGGGGVPDAVTHLLAVEGFAYGDPGIALAAVWGGAPALVIARCGTRQQQERFLPPFATDANRRGAVALYEGFGRSPGEYASTVDASSRGVRVRGTKVGVARPADAWPLVVVGRDGTGALRAAVIDPGTAGVVGAPPGRHLALDAAGLSTVDLDADLPADALLGGPEADPAALAAVVARIRLFVAAAALGTARRAIDYASNYATERVAFGKPIAAFQGVSFPLAEALVRTSAVKLELLDLAARVDDGTASDTEVAGAIAYATGVAVQSTRDAVQVLGGHGFITDHPVELWYRSAETLAALDHDPLFAPFTAAL